MLIALDESSNILAFAIRDCKARIELYDITLRKISVLKSIDMDPNVFEALRKSSNDLGSLSEEEALELFFKQFEGDIELEGLIPKSMSGRPKTFIEFTYKDSPVYKSSFKLFMKALCVKTHTNNGFAIFNDRLMCVHTKPSRGVNAYYAGRYPLGHNDALDPNSGVVFNKGTLGPDKFRPKAYFDFKVDLSLLYYGNYLSFKNLL